VFNAGEVISEGANVLRMSEPRAGEKIGFLAFALLFELIYPRWAGVPLHLFGTREDRDAASE
jgi:hypothetical protein